MTMLPGPGGAAWKIVPPVVARTAPDASGALTAGKVVTFALDGGYTGTVFVPDAQFTPDGVAALVQPAADNLAAVMRLTSGG